MNILSSIFKQIKAFMQTSQKFENYNQFVGEFERTWRGIGQQLQQRIK